MGRYMVELGLTPAARSRVMADSPIAPPERLRIERRIVTPGVNGGPPTSEFYDAQIVYPPRS